MAFKPLCPSTRSQVYMLFDEGHTQSSIARTTGVSIKTVQKLLRFEKLAASPFIPKDTAILDQIDRDGGLPVLREVELSGNRRAVCVPTLRGPELVISYPVLL